MWRVESGRGERKAENGKKETEQQKRIRRWRSRKEMKYGEMSDGVARNKQQLKENTKEQEILEYKNNKNE